MQSYLDSDSTLDDRDLEHLKSCPSCGRFYNDNVQFNEQLRGASETALAALHDPDWEEILLPVDPEASGEHSSTLRPHGRRLVSLLPKVALILLFVGVGGLFEVRQYQLQRARSFLRTDTEAFVSSLVSSPLFPQGQAEASGIQSAWFDATSMELSLPVAPGVTAPTGGRDGASGAGS